MTIHIIDRNGWLARPPRNRSTIPTPSAELWLHHTADDHRGPAGVRAVQAFHMDNRGWSDIAYSYLIDRDTLDVFEGRGAGVLGGHTFGRNSISHAICVMGNFDKVKPSTALLERIAELVAYGHTKGWWPAQLTGGHRDVRATRCPGDHLYPRIPGMNARSAVLLDPDTNHGDNMQAELVERLEAAVRRLGYSIHANQELELREVEAIESMETGIRRLLAERKHLLDHLNAIVAGANNVRAGTTTTTEHAIAALEILERDQ